jgi:S1-C subfamily serine protease
MRVHRIGVLLASVGLAAAAAVGCGGPQAGEQAALRAAQVAALGHTAAVDVYRECKDSVVNVGFRRKDEADPKTVHTEFGTGVVVHEAGYVLTNAHALRHGGSGTVGFQGGLEYPVRVVAVDDGRDLAVLKIAADRRFKPVKLGYSRDLVVGEQIVTMGNPYGMGLTVTLGIVSALGRSTKSDFTYFPQMIQTEASINPGSSGGPLLNVLGEMVGLNTTAKTGANDIGFAIPVDRIREALPEVLDPEGRFGFLLGLRVATDGSAVVTEVAAGSPAEAAGVRVGDAVMGVGPAAVASGVDFYFALLDCKAGQAVRLDLLRDGRTVQVTATPTRVELRAPDAASGLVPGLSVEYYKGTWDRVPDFASLKPADSAKAATFDLVPYKGKDRFALRFTGYVDVPADGVWAFYTRSDDGSRLLIGDRLVVDNDGAHPPIEERGFISLKAGKHAITVGFFHRTEVEVLKVLWEGPGIKKQEVPASAFFTRP